MLTMSPFWPLDPGVPSNPSSLASLWEEEYDHKDQRKEHVNIYVQ